MLHASHYNANLLTLFSSPTPCAGSSLALLVSPYELVRSVYPEHPWEQWRFVKVPRGFWDDLNNQRDFLQHVARKRGVSLSELVESDIIRNGGMYLYKVYFNSVANAHLATTGLTLLTMYGGSIKNILQQLFPDKLLEEPTYRLRKQPVLSASLSKIYPKQGKSSIYFFIFLVLTMF